MNTETLTQHLDNVRRVIGDALGETSLGPMVPEFTSLIGSGKMLRARLALQLGEACGTPTDILIHAGAAIEMIHAASLLHDDVIDGATTRRGTPSFWVEKGVQGAILLGDLFYCRAVNIVCQTGDARLTNVFVEKVCEMCDGETEQELLLRGVKPEWEKCVSVAKRKTGSLFAFVGHAAGGDDRELRLLLEQSAYDVGTAYQVADDLLDASGNAELAGKTLGTDAARNKLTAAASLPAGSPDPREFIRKRIEAASSRLAASPGVRQAWDTYVTDEMEKAFVTFTAGFKVPQVA